MFCLSGYHFSDPLFSLSSLEDASGVYVVMTLTDLHEYQIIDVGAASRIKSDVRAHARARCWLRYANGGQLRYAVRYTPTLAEDSRAEIERQIRDQYRPPCSNGRC